MRFARADLEEEGYKLWSLYRDDVSYKGLGRKEFGKHIPYLKQKSLQRARKAEKLGAIIDRDAGTLKGSTVGALNLEQLIVGILPFSAREGPSKALLGRKVHTLQFRRPLFGMFDFLWKDISDDEVLIPHTVRSKVSGGDLVGRVQPTFESDGLRAKLREVVTASSMPMREEEDRRGIWLYS